MLFGVSLEDNDAIEIAVSVGPQDPSITFAK